MRKQPRALEVVQIDGPVTDVALDPGDHSVGMARPERGRTYERGVADGMARARAELGTALDAAQAMSRTLAEKVEADSTATMDSVVRLGLGVARKIVAREINAHDLAAAARRAMKKLVNASHVTVRLNPLDLETMREEAGDLGDEARDTDSVALVADESVGRGGCVVDAGGQSVDARIESQLARMWELLTGEDHEPSAAMGGKTC